MVNKKEILVLGSSGMLGHMLELYLNKNTNYKVTGLNRKDIEVTDLDTTMDTIKGYKSIDVIVNAIGILNNSTDETKYMKVNAAFPNELAEYCMDTNKKLIHISTNCVFKDRGPHSEAEYPNAEDLYGYSKSLGEVGGDNLTIRTSIIGPELKKDGIGLMHQFIKNKDFTSGYFNVGWNGVTTLELSKYIVDCIETDKKGIINYYTKTDKYANKFDLLDIINKEFNLGKNLKPVLNRTQHQSLLDGPNYTEHPITDQIRDLYTIIKDNKKLYKGNYK